MTTLMVPIAFSAAGWLFGVCTVLVPIGLYGLWRTRKKAPLFHTPVMDRLERERQHKAGLERYVRTFSSALAERHIVIPIDAESDEEAWAAITSYRRAA